MHTLSLHDALPISIDVHVEQTGGDGPPSVGGGERTGKSLQALHIMRMLIEAQAAAAQAAASSR